MAERVLLDTDVLIDFFRGHPKAVAYMHGLSVRPVISVVTVAELFAGVREGSERTALETFLRRAVVIEADEEIATLAGQFLKQFRNSHNTGLADALIAATADISCARLVTLNARHFPMAGSIVVPYTK